MKPKITHLLMLTMLLSPVVAMTLDSETQEGQPRAEKAHSRQQYEIKLTIHFLAEGQRANRREYSLVLQNDGSGNIRMIKKQPVPLPDGKADYIETGVKCDLQCQVRDGVLAISGALVLSNVDRAGQATGPRPPVDEVQCRFQTDVVPGTATVVARIDDPDKNTRWEIEILASPAGAK